VHRDRKVWNPIANQSINQSTTNIPIIIIVVIIIIITTTTTTNTKNYKTQVPHISYG